MLQTTHGIKMFLFFHTLALFKKQERYIEKIGIFFFQEMPCATFHKETQAKGLLKHGYYFRPKAELVQNSIACFTQISF